MTDKTQNSMLQFTSIIFKRWFQQAPKEELEKIMMNLKQELNILEKSMQLVEENGENQALIKKIFIMFESFLKAERNKTE